jgi:phosphoglycolate phosphatase
MKGWCIMKNIIFDVDGTLWDTTEVVAGAWNRAVDEAGGIAEVITGDRLKQEFGKTMDKIAANLFPDMEPKMLEEVLAKCYIFEHEAVDQNQENLLFPDVKETLQKLAEKCRLFIVSNCQSGYIELFMKKAGIETLIKDHECYGDTGKGKGENIKLLVERNKLEDVAYVGDTQGDYESTVYAGIPFIFAEYGFGSVTGFDHSISSFKQLLELV